MGKEALRRGWRRVLIVAAALYWLAATLAITTEMSKQHTAYLTVFGGGQEWTQLTGKAQTEVWRLADESTRNFGLMQLIPWAFGFLLIVGAYVIIRWVVRGFLDTGAAGANR